jgi:hypothetical protein
MAHSCVRAQRTFTLGLICLCFKCSVVGSLPKMTQLSRFTRPWIRASSGKTINYRWDARATGVSETEFTITVQVPTSPYLKSTIFMDITPCSPLSVNRLFGGIYRLYLQVRKNKLSNKPEWKQVESLPSSYLFSFLSCRCLKYRHFLLWTANYECSRSAEENIWTHWRVLTRGPRKITQ